MKPSIVLVSAFFIVINVFSGGAHAAIDDPLFRVMPIGDPTGLEIGRGIDIITGAPRGDCVEPITTPEALTGQDNIQFQSNEITSINELNTALGVSASAQFNGGFGGASASASFAQSLSVQEYSFFYFVRASVAIKGGSLKAVHLKSEYLTLLRAGTPAALKHFRDLCGDGYISEFAEGGEFEAIVRIGTKTRKEREDISASFSGSTSFASGAAAFSSQLEKYARTNDVRISTYRRSGNGQPIAITAADIQNQASTLPAIAKSGPIPLRMGIFSYLTVVVDNSVGIQDLAEREIQISKLALFYNEITQRVSEITYIVDNPNEFYSNSLDLPQLVDEMKELQTDKAQIENFASKCIQNGGACSFNDISLPSISVRPGRK
jgi:hypothetical protein